MKRGRGPAPPRLERRRQAPPEDQAGGALPLSGKLYLAAVYALALTAAACAVVFGSWETALSNAGGQLFAFVLLTLLATVSQLFVVDAPNRHSYHTTPAFLLTAAFLLQPVLLLPLVVVAMIPEWLRYRYPWYIQTFNIATYLLNVLAAWFVFDALAPHGLVLSWSTGAAVASAGLAFAALNHLMVALVLWLARGIPLSKSGVISRESLETDMALLGVGTGMAVFWTVEPFLIVLEIVPLFLIYRALFVPKLKEEAHLDAKTGLLVARRFMQLLNEEMDRVVKSPRATSLIMADLDLFRNINNSYGHLAGDEVLLGVAGVLSNTLRSDDLIGRFGGEEFVILLKATDAEGAMRAAERVRLAVESTGISVSDFPDPLRVTMSLGVASFPDPCPDLEGLLRDADRAVYRSKLDGRNRVTMATPALDEEEPASERSYSRIVESLAFALDARGAVVDGHTLRLTALSLAVAREMGVREGSAAWRTIEQASLLHDVGKLAISSTVLYKQGPLSEEEWAQMRMHPQLGWAMLSQIDLLKPAAEIVRAHHEHYDGSGYPAGLAGEAIPLGARIFAVVDAFDAITSSRPYRAAQSEDAALQEIVKHRGAQFDPDVVDALLRALLRPESGDPVASCSGSPA